MSRPRQICPRRLEIVIEKIDLALESFEPGSAGYRILAEARAQIKVLLQGVKA